MMLLLAALTASTARAADVVTIGTANTPHTAPIMADANYALSQEVYTASEIQHVAGQIGAIAFNTDKGDLTRKLDIYITHTSQTSVDDFTAVTANDLCFSGEVYFKTGQWTVITLDKAFNYNGSSNLLITIDDNTNVTYGWGALKNYIFYGGSSECRFAYDDNLNFDPTNPSIEGISISPSTVSWKNQLQITFEEYLSPSRLAVTDITDRTAQVQCSLRGEASAWNLRYRQLDTEAWTEFTGLTDRGKIIEGLTPATKYEVQVQAVFAGDKKSEWTSSLAFNTSCCPQEQLSEIRYSANSFNNCESAFQIVDAETGIEVAYIRMNSSETITGTLSLCCGRSYKVNWISRPLWPQSDYSCTFSLYFPPHDAFYTMNYGEAPDAPNGEEGKSFELTTFVMDCTEYDFAMPTQLNAYDETYEGATLSWTSDDAKQWLIAYSSNPDFDPESNDIIPFLADSNPFTVTGLDANTTYYFAVSAVEAEDVAGASALNAHRAKGDTRKVKSKNKEKLVKLIKTGRWSKKTAQKLAKEMDIPYKVLYKAYKKDRARLIRKLKDKAKRFNLLTQKMSSNQQAVINDLIKTRLLEGDGDIWKEGQKTIFSMPGSGPFDQVILVPAKKGAQVKVLVAEAKSGLKKDPYTIGWVSKKYIIELGGDPDSPDLIPINLFRTMMKMTRRYWVKAYDTPSSTDEEVMEATDEDYQPDENASQTPARRAAETGAEGYLWIRHNETNGGGLIFNDFEVVNPEDVSGWDLFFMDEGVAEHLLEVTPSTTYLAKLEPVYDDGSKGVMSPVTVFTTLAESDYPTESEFTVGANDQKVNFGKVNLRYNQMTEKWSFAEHAYDVIGNDNANTNASGKLYPADVLDLFCWSTAQNDYGSYYYYYYEDDEDANPYFQGEFVDWGTNPSFVATYGEGWRTLSKAEWNYLLTERPNAATLTTHASVAGTKGLVILPDAWTAPDGIMLSDKMTAEQWAAIEETGAVFLPAAGQFLKGRTLEDIGTAGYYWTSSPSDVEMIGSENEAYIVSFTDTEMKTSTVTRRAGSSIRMVKTSEGTTAIKQVTTTVQRPVNNNWYDLSGRRITGMPTQKGIYINKGRKVVIR